jgi:DNA polymerase-3 subunit gamma/tau
VSYQVLARKWRPQVFGDVIGQNHVVKTLQNALANTRIAHAFLFAGQRGVGKTSVARILAKALNCQQGPTPEPCCKCVSCKAIAEGTTIDVLEIDGASNTGVDDVRELRESVKYVPSQGKYKIYIIDEVHMLSNSAFNALLKTLEEPPAHAIFMFATTEPQKIPPTVLSRCQRFDLRPISTEMLIKQLLHITAQEKISISEKALGLIAREAEGSMRDSQSILDRVISYAGNEISDTAVIEVLGIVDRDLLLRTSRALLDRDGEACITIVRDLFQAGYDSRQFYQSFLEHLRNIIVVKTCENAAQLINLLPEECEVLAEHVKEAKTETLQRLFDVWLKAEDEIYHSSMPQIVLEMLLLRMVYLKSLLPLDEALTKLNELEKVIFSGNTATRADSKQRKAAAVGSDSPPMEEDTYPHPHDDLIQGDHNQKWEGFLRFVKKEKPMLGALLDHGKCLHMDDTKLSLGFPAGSIFLESAQDGDKVSQIKKLCEEFCGKKLQIKVTPFKQEESPSEQVQSPRQEVNNVEIQGSEALRDPLVNEALSMFNGKIVEVREEGDVGSESNP